MFRSNRKNNFIFKAALVLVLVNFLCPLQNFAADVFLSGEEKFIYPHEDRPDPFTPLLGTKGQSKETGPSRKEEMDEYLNKIKVNGIVWDDKMPLVMINDKIRKKGDIVENLTVELIKIDSVVLTYYELSHEIFLIKRKKLDDQGGIL